ncbi:MAG: NAD(P)/FAD-dependent oxidoreductase [Paenisporosarcina sp.]
MKDCIIIGGGPAGLNAALVLGRARRDILLVDQDNARNKVTHASHGFITRDGIKPHEFREIAHKELKAYPSVEIVSDQVVKLQTVKDGFNVTTDKGYEWDCRKVILATGVKEKFPNIPTLQDFYGTSIFNCPYCDGWEYNDQPLAVFGLVDYTIHMTGILKNWSRDLIIFTNGEELNRSQKKAIQKLDIQVETAKIKRLHGESRRLKSIELESGQHIARVGGFITPELIQASKLGQQVGLVLDDLGGYKSDDIGHTEIPHLFVAGEASKIYPSQLIIAAASGVQAAMAVNVELTHDGILGSKPLKKNHENYFF